jgi:hypothetical protein
MATTSGLVSAYQLVDYSAQIVVRHNLASTGAVEFAAEIVTLPDALSLRDTELVKVKIPPQYKALAIAILSRRARLVLPDSILVIARSVLRILREAGIPCEVVE